LAGWLVEGCRWLRMLLRLILCVLLTAFAAQQTL
jgi:hypothetical protein